MQIPACRTVLQTVPPQSSISSTRLCVGGCECWDTNMAGWPWNRSCWCSPADRCLWRRQICEEKWHSNAAPVHCFYYVFPFQKISSGPLHQPLSCVHLSSSSRSRSKNYISASQIRNKGDSTNFKDSMVNFLQTTNFRLYRKGCEKKKISRVLEFLVHARTNGKTASLGL